MPTNKPEWTVAVDDQIAADLLNSINRGKMYPGGLRSMNEATIVRLGSIKIQIFSDEHPPPHFRVDCGGETADFTIRDCTQLTGGASKWKYNVIEWHARNKALLIAKWNASRPTGCPVGEYSES